MGQSSARHTTTNMFLFLSLLATALAAPQYPYNMYYPGLSYQPMPVGYNPAVVRGVYNPYPMYPSAYPLVPQQQQPIQRGLISFENLLQVNGKFKTDDTTTPAMVVSGTFEFDQNFGTDLLTETMLTTRSTSTPDPPTSLARMSHLNLLHPALPLMARCLLRSIPPGKSTDSG